MGSQVCGRIPHRTNKVVDLQRIVAFTPFEKDGRATVSKGGQDFTSGEGQRRKGMELPKGICSPHLGFSRLTFLEELALSPPLLQNCRLL